jgi:serine/threonine protein kinase
LLGRKKSNIKLEWTKRSAICVGTAKGLAYLHEELPQHIVHRDIKASNVLLDKDFNPKIGDFGMAKLFPDDITHISTRIAGTTYVYLVFVFIIVLRKGSITYIAFGFDLNSGYLAPEYALGGQLTKKADVYSFGVLLLEIISGKSSSRTNWEGSQKSLLEWVHKSQFPIFIS